MVSNTVFEKDEKYAALFLLGSIIGAGIFGLPYFSARVGLLLTIIFLLFGIFVNASLSILYLRSFVLTKSERLETMAEKIGGKKLFLFSHILKLLIAILLSFIYVVGISDIIKILLLKFFGLNIDMLYLEIILIFVFFFLILPKVNLFAEISAKMVYVLLVLMFLCSIVLFPYINFNNINFLPSTSNIFAIFAAIGPFVFANLDVTTSPQAFKIVNYNHEKMYRVIVITAITLIIIYLFFILAFFGAFGTNIADNAVKSLAKIDLRLFLLGSIAVLLAMLTSAVNFLYLVKDTLVDLYKFSNLKAALVVTLPLFISLILPKSFGVMLEIVGTLAVLLMIIQIVTLSYLAEKKYGECKEVPILYPNLIRIICLLSILIAFLASLV